MSERMLVIDDEKDILEACQMIFEEEGFEVTVTNDPREGIRLAKESSFDVVLSDWQMPGLDGMQVIEAIDQHSPQTAVVMMSGQPAVGRAAEAMKRGAMDYVVKPFTPKEIVNAVHQALRRKVMREKKELGRFESMMKGLPFPVPSGEDNAPQTIAETVAQKIGVKKVTSSRSSVLILGVLAGAYIGFGGLFATSVTFDMAQTMSLGLTKLIGGAAFSVGLMLVVIAGAELFTGNNLMISSAMEKEISYGTMIRRWGLVYVANFIGSILLTLLFFYSGLWKTGGEALGAAAVKIAYGKVTLSFGEALVRAIGCNWLVCLAVWMALAARHTEGKIFAIFFPIMAFAAIGFEHCVANMYFIPVGIFLRDWAGLAAPAGFDPQALGWLSFVWKNLVPVTIGNILGGVVFVGMSYWSAYMRYAKS